MSNVAQADNSANNATVANNLDKKSITDSTLSNNNDLKSTEMQSTVADQAAADDANTADQTATEKQATVTNQATVDNTVNTADQATQAVAEKTTTPASTAANTQLLHQLQRYVPQQLRIQVRRQLLTTGLV